MRATTLLVMASLLAGGCDGQGSTISFEGGPCKKEAAAEQAALPSFLLTSWNGDELLGLTCIAWSPGGEASEVGLDLLNFPGACGASWKGEGSVDGADILLRVYNPGCMLSACGICIYDWSFGLAGVEDDAHANLAIEVDPCPGEQELEVHFATLPGPLSVEGIVCRWTNVWALDWHAGEAGICGELHMPCGGGGICDEGAAGQCNGELTCANRGDGEQTCLAPCAGDADCLPAGLMYCGDDNLCRLADSW